MWYMNEERKQLQKMAADFTKAEIKPFIKEMEENNKFPHEILRKAGELDLIALMFPEKAGGFGPSWIDSGIVIEEMSKESNTMACCMAGIYAGASLLCAIGNDEQIEIILKPVVRGETYIVGAQCEPTGVARLDDFVTTASFDADGVVINGGKIFCTGAGEADYYSVTCKTAEPYEPPLGKFTIVLVPKDTPGLKIGHIENKMGWHGSFTGQIYLDNCRVPMSQVLASYDMNAAMAMQGGYGIAALLSAGMLGSCVGVYEKTLRYAKERKHGDTSLFDSYQAMRHTFAELWMEIEAYRCLVYSVLEDMDRNDQEVVGRAWAAKVKGAKLLERVASECMVLNGGNGVIVENDIERYLRDAKMNAIGCFALPHMTDVTGFEAESDGAVLVKKNIGKSVNTYRVTLPAVIGVDRKLNQVRHPNVRGIFSAKKKPLVTLTANELEPLEEGRLGLAGSPTQPGEYRDVEYGRECRELENTAELLKIINGARK